MEKEITIRDRFQQLGESLLALLGIDTHRAEPGADRAQAADAALDDAATAAEMDAQKTLDVFNLVLTAHGRIELQFQQQQAIIDHWDTLAREDSASAIKLTEESPERARKEALVKKALRNKDIATMEMKPLQEAYETSKPLAEQALQRIEQIGLSREDALSQTAVLKVQNATAKGRLMLAQAAQGDGIERTRGLLAMAKAKVYLTMAQAETEEQMSALTSTSPPAAEGQSSTPKRDQRVEAEFTKMMGELGGTPTLT